MSPPRELVARETTRPVGVYPVVTPFRVVVRRDPRGRFRRVLGPSCRSCDSELGCPLFLPRRCSSSVPPPMSLPSTTGGGTGLGSSHRIRLGDLVTRASGRRRGPSPCQSVHHRPETSTPPFSVPYAPLVVKTTVRYVVRWGDLQPLSPGVCVPSLSLYVGHRPLVSYFHSSHEESSDGTRFRRAPSIHY